MTKEDWADYAMELQQTLENARCVASDYETALQEIAIGVGFNWRRNIALEALPARDEK